METENLGLVLYTDGSANPNPGHTGWSCHGYIFQESEKVKKYDLYDSLLTNQGYVPLTEVTDESKPVTPLKFVNFYGSSEKLDSNNSAELTAMKNALKFFVENEYKFKRVVVHTDSSYVQKGINEWSKGWIKNGWKRQDGLDVNNKGLWLEILDAIEKYMDKGIELEINWIKGHNGHLGNIIADSLASNGSFNSSRGIYHDEYSLIDAKEYLINKVDVNPILDQPRMIFNSDSSKTTTGLYYMVKPSVPDNQIGVNDINTAYSIVYLKEPNSLLESIRNRQSVISDNQGGIFLARTDSIFSKKYFQWLRNSIYHNLKRNSAKNNSDNSLLFFNNEPITVELKPMGLSIRVVEYISYLEYLFNLYLENDFSLSKDFTVVDITDKFFNVEEKKTKTEVKTNKVLKPEVKPGFKNTSIEINIDGVSFKIPMSLGLDIPDRNVLKRLEVENPVISLILRKDSDHLYRYFVIIETSESTSVWSNMSSASIYV